MRLRAIGWALAVVAIGCLTARAPAQNGQGFLAGRVFEDLNGNGRFDTGEPCVRSVVSIRPTAGGGERTDEVACGQDSVYVFTGLPFGSYTLAVRETTPPDFGTTSVVVEIPKESQRDLPLTRRSQGQISGEVRLDRNGNRQLDSGEPGLAGVRIDLQDAATGAAVATVTTGAGGAFALTVPRAGDFVLLERDPPGHLSTGAFEGTSGNATRLDANRFRLRLAAGASATGLLYLDRSTAVRSIAGRVLVDSNNDGTLGDADVPVPDVEIRLLDAAGNPLTSTRSLDDGSYFFDAPTPGRDYLVAPAPPYGLTPRQAFAGPGAAAVGSGAILVRALQSGTVYDENNFLLRREAPVQPLPKGPAELQGYVFAIGGSSRSGVPLSGVTILLRDASGALRAGATTGSNGQFRFTELPIGTYTFTEIDPPGYRSLTVAVGQRGQRVDANTLRVEMVSGQTLYTGFQFLDQPGDDPAAVNVIRGQVTEERAGVATPLAGVLLVLEDETQRLLRVTATDRDGRYEFARLPMATYRIVEADPPGLTGGDALPGPHARKVDGNTLQVAMVAGVTVYGANNFVEAASLAGPESIQRLAQVGDALAVSGRLGIFSSDSLEQDSDVTAVRRVGDDGTVYMADYAGASFLRMGGGASTAAAGSARVQQAGGLQLLLDTTARDPVDGAGLARLLRIETARNGVSGVLALRADNTRAIYRLEKGILTRHALLSDPTFGAELAISDAGQIAYVALTSSGRPAVFQTVEGRPVQVMGPGQVVRDDAGRILLRGEDVERYQNLTSNGAGDLAFHVSLPLQNGRRPQLVVRKSGRGLSLVAATGQLVAPARGARETAVLTGLGRPRIGPDGTVVCRGSGDSFINFFIDGPSGRFQPMLPGTGWNREDTTFDYDVAAGGLVAFRAAQGASAESSLYLRLPAGGVVEVIQAGSRFRPVGRPAFTPQGSSVLFYFQAGDTTQPADRNGRVPVYLYRTRISGNLLLVEGVAPPGGQVPGRPGLRLLEVTQRPVVWEGGLVFSALYGNPESYPVPTAGLFRVPPGGTLSQAALLAEEGDPLPGADRLAMLRQLSAGSDGSFLFGALLPGAGGLIGTVAGDPPAQQQPAARRATAGFRTQAAQAALPTSLLAIGQPLDRPGRRLQALVGRLTALGGNRQLFVARFAQEGGVIGEGLFTLARDGVVKAVAVTGDPAPGLPGARFTAFADTAAFTLNPPAVSADENVAFKARLERDGRELFGLFHWNGAAVLPVAVSEPTPDDLALSADDRPPYALDGWAAGPAGRTYLLERHQTRLGTRTSRLFERGPGGLLPLAVPGVTPVGAATRAPLSDLFQFVLNRAGGLFLSTPNGSAGAVLAHGATGLATLAAQGQPIPRFADGSEAPGVLFDGTFTLMPDSARGDLVFRAGVAKAGEKSRQAQFHLDPQGALRTIMVEGLGVSGARDLVVQTLGTGTIVQSVNGTTVSAFRDGGRWHIVRARRNLDAQGRATFTTAVVAREGQTLPGGGRIVSLDPSLLLDLPSDAGPVFTVNDTGDVAFLASDGARWGIYLFSDARR